MSLFDDVDKLQNEVHRKPGESDERLAHRLFNMQMEVYSTYAGGDLYDPEKTFHQLNKETRDGWIEKAKNWEKKPAPSAT